VIISFMDLWCVSVFVSNR